MEKAETNAKNHKENPRFSAEVNDPLNKENRILLITDTFFHYNNIRDGSFHLSYSWLTLTKLSMTEDTMLLDFSNNRVLFETDKISEIFKILSDIIPRLLRPTELISLGYFTQPEDRAPPTPNSVFLRINEKSKLMKRELSKETIEEFHDLIVFGQEYVDLSDFSYQDEAVPTFFDVLPLLPTILSVSIQSLKKVDVYSLMSAVVCESGFLEHIEIDAPVSRHFHSFLRHLSKNKDLPIFGLSFKNSNFSENNIKSLVRTMSDRYICSIGFHNCFNNDSFNAFYSIFLPQMCNKLTVLNLDSTENIDLSKLFSFKYQALELISLENCKIDISNVFNLLSTNDSNDSFPLLKGINLSKNESSNCRYDKLKLPSSLSTLMLSNIKWDDNALFEFFNFISNSFKTELRTDLSKTDASEEEWQNVFTQIQSTNIQSIRTLIWDENPVSLRFIHFLKKNPQIEYLSLSGCFTENDLDLINNLGEYLAASNVSSLVLRGTKEKFIGEILSNLLNYLCKMPKLEYLDVCNSNSRDIAIPFLSQLIEADTPLSFLNFDGLIPRNPKMIFDLLYKAAGNKRAIAISFPVDDLRYLLHNRKITREQYEWVSNLYKLPQPTMNEKATSLEQPFEIYRENWKPRFPLYLKPMNPSPDGIRTEDMINTDVFSEERTEMTVSVTEGGNAELVPLTKDETEEKKTIGTKGISKANNESMEFTSLETIEVKHRVDPNLNLSTKDQSVDDLAQITDEEKPDNKSSSKISEKAESGRSNSSTKKHKHHHSKKRGSSRSGSSKGGRSSKAGSSKGSRTGRSNSSQLSQKTNQSELINHEPSLVVPPEASVDGHPISITPSKNDNSNELIQNASVPPIQDNKTHGSSKISASSSVLPVTKPQQTPNAKVQIELENKQSPAQSSTTGSTKKRKKHRRQNTQPKIQQASIVDGNIIISWRFPIEFSLEDAEKRAIVLAERKNNLDDLVEEIPKL